MNSTHLCVDKDPRKIKQIKSSGPNAPMGKTAETAAQMPDHHRSGNDPEQTNYKFK